ncbi:GTP-binding protein HflX [Longilinea arvoryzae]|uniref:GTPase HflX n=1 Tax=Longilinea arvoryzae TaxID=360412 RepID=A0A0S7BM34_9CHLR|nr:GTPase HflX [Longilinea arvoryzae]GAP14837.1 GTP-binding protein HflX [Longilinea arvoryzae]
MSKRVSEPTAPPVERAFLVGVEVKSQPGLLSLEDSLSELSLLCETAGLEVVGETKQRLDTPHPNTYIGSGKVEEIRLLVEETLSNVVVFDTELSPTHQRELEEKLGDNVRVLDRTAIILDIFAQHANTREGKLQVELAQYEYRLPRLTRAWTHLARQAGGGGGRTGSVGGVGLRGPGETQLEVDRRDIHRRISALKKELENVRAHRSRHRDQRRRTQIPVIALVGYTNAGKSTLLNHLSKADVYVADKLFATLDPTTRRVELPGGHWVLMTDTVGFIQKLPTQLIAAFRATLEEITEADLLIHLVDATHPNAHVQWDSVKETLSAIDAGNIPMITALNKIDQLSDPEEAQRLTTEYEDAIAISALKGAGIQNLLSSIERELFETFVPVTVYLPFQEGQLISLFHEQGQIATTENTRTGVTIQGNLPGRLIARYQPFFERPKSTEE